MIAALHSRLQSFVMTPTMGIIVALLYVVIQVISWLAKESAKKKERERQMEAAERARISTAKMEVPGSSGEQTRPTAQADWRMGAQPPTSLKTERVPTSRQPTADDLAELRKRQLAQMRNAPVGRPATARQSPAPARPRSKPAPSTVRVDQPATRAEGHRQLEEAEKIRRDRQAQELRQRDVLARAQLAQEATKQARQTEVRAAAAQMRRESDEPAAPRPTALGANRVSAAFHNRLSNPTALRELIILKEVLDPPVAMRQ